MKRRPATKKKSAAVRAKRPTRRPAKPAVRKAAPKHYYDVADEGPAKRTSHPRFVRLCPDDFFYDATDEFAPFGSDAGADALHDLEVWVRKKRGKVRTFIDRTLTAWDMTIPSLTESRESAIVEWLDDRDIALCLPSVDQLLIAAAFGQYKITGAIEDAVLALGLAAAKREAIATAFYERADPTWEHGEEKAEADQRVLTALEAMADQR